MIDLLKKAFKIGPSVDYAELVKQGAVILDVRTKGEYKGGHIQGSINIAVDELLNNLHRFPDTQKTIITCCATGFRSASANRMLRSKGYNNVHNAGSWVSLQNKI